MDDVNERIAATQKALLDLGAATKNLAAQQELLVATLGKVADAQHQTAQVLQGLADEHREAFKKLGDRIAALEHDAFGASPPPRPIN